MRRVGTGFAAVVFTTLIGVPSARADARADELGVCMASHETGQLARLDGHLLDARKRLRACAAEQCPSAMQRDCLELLADVDREVPSIMVGASGDAGDLDDVVVTLDGTVVRRKLDGLPIELDPGSHELLFQTSNRPPTHETVVVRAGERKRMVKVDWSTRRPVGEAGPQGAPMERPVPFSTYLFAGGALAGTVSFGVFAFLGHAKQRDLESCKPFCSNAQVQQMTSRYVAADVSLAVAGASAVTALVTFLLRPSSPVASPAVGVVPTSGGAYATMHVAF